MPHASALSLIMHLRSRDACTLSQPQKTNHHAHRLNLGQTLGRCRSCGCRLRRPPLALFWRSAPPAFPVPFSFFFQEKTTIDSRNLKVVSPLPTPPTPRMGALVHPSERIWEAERAPATTSACCKSKSPVARASHARVVMLMVLAGIHAQQRSTRGQRAQRASISAKARPATDGSAATGSAFPSGPAACRPLFLTQNSSQTQPHREPPKRQSHGSPEGPEKGNRTHHGHRRQHRSRESLILP